MTAFLCEARPQAVEDELYGQGREQHAEHAGEDVGAGLTEEPHDAGGEEKRDEGKEQDREEHSPVGLAKIISSARKKRRIPPAMRNAGMLIPRASSRTLPASAKRNRIAAPIAVPRIAASLLRFSG